MQSSRFGPILLQVRVRRAWLLIAFGVLFGIFLVRPSRAEDLTLERAIQTALIHRPELRASDLLTRSAAAMRHQAGALPNPRVFYQSENLGPSMDFANTVDTYAYLNQPVEISGKRHARIGTAAAAVSMATVNGDMQRRDIEYAVARAYWEALRLTYLRRMAEESQGFYHEILEYNQHRFEEGKLSAVDLMRIKLEDARAQTRLEASRLAETQALERLAAEMGLPVPGSWKLVADFAILNDPRPGALAEGVSRQRLEVKLAQQRVESARANLVLQKAQGRPDLDVLFGYKRTQGENTMLAGFQVPLPIFDRNRAGVQAAQSNVQAVRESLSGDELRSQAGWDLARTAYTTWKHQVEALYGPMATQSREIADISRAAYREGGLDLLRLLDAERLRVETQTAWAEALGNYHQSVLSLNFAAGMEP
ncbi:MAG TPA: TolC family protein [Terracidiphilus sp.]|jgi:cobalt-zinc-cadmium efflux system outer membrane protein|nr:TolC family protein [Terracidiphilus sp.]